MDTQAGSSQIARSCALTVKFRGLAHGHAELMFVQPGGNVGMGPSVNIGIYAEGKARGLAQVRRAGGKQLKLAAAFGVEEQNAAIYGEIDFVCQLAHAGEDDFASGLAAQVQDAL